MIRDICNLPNGLSTHGNPIFKWVTHGRPMKSSAHTFFRASFPNFVDLVNPGVDVVRHPRGFPKWYIRKYSVWHFLRNRPIVVIFDDFHNKLTILALFVMYSAPI